MTTARQIIDGAAEHIGVKTAEVTLESEDFQVFLDNMNDMLLEWADIGLTPGFSEVFNGDDFIEIDNNARAAVKAALAIRCAVPFEKVITIGLVNLASETMQRLETSTAFIGDVDYPDTLPLGSGNNGCNIDTDRRFFNSNKPENF